MSAANQMPPGLAGYLAEEERADRADTSQLQRAGMTMQLRQGINEIQRDAQLRGLLAQSGGNVERAIQAAIDSGNVGAAQKLAQVLEVTRKQNTTRIAPPGSQVLGPNNEVVHSVPFAPQRPQASPEIVQLQE